MKKIAGLFIITIIFAVSIFLIFQIPNPSKSGIIEEAAFLGQPSDEGWLGIFLRGQRIGYSFTKISRTGTGLMVESRSRMTLIMMHEQRTLNTHIFARTDNEYTLKDFVMEIETQGHSTKIEGKIEEKQLELTSYSQGIPYTQTIGLQDKPYFPDAIEEVIKKKELKSGDKITLPYFDPTTQSSSSATIRIFEKEKVEVLGEYRVGLRVEIDFMGLKNILWLDENYKSIKESSPALGMEMIPLSREQALAEVKPTDVFDLISFFAVKLDKPIPDPRKLSYLKLELNNITVENLDLTDDFQNLSAGEPLVIESYLPSLGDLPDLTVPIDEQNEFLEPSVYIQCEDPKIIAKADEFVGGEKNAKRVVEKLVEGVNSYIRKNPIASLPSAIDVLETKEGDCNEHSILFAALARAKGIPTKIYVGLVNLQGSAYYYHAWCAVWLGKWIPVDPTLNQFPADVGHLKLKEGGISEQAKVLKVVGRLTINALDYK